MSEVDHDQEHDTPNFEFEFHNMVGELGETEERLRDEAEKRLNKLAQGHTDIIGAAVALEREQKDTQTGYLIRARVVAYGRPDDIAGIEKDDNAMGALKGALTKVERQIREKREKLRERYKQPKNAFPINEIPAEPIGDEAGAGGAGANDFTPEGDLNDDVMDNDEFKDAPPASNY